MKVLNQISLFDPDLISEDDGENFYTPTIRGFYASVNPNDVLNPDPVDYLQVDLNEYSTNTNLDTLYRGVVIEGVVRPKEAESPRIAQGFTHNALLTPGTNDIEHEVIVEPNNGSIPESQFDIYQISYCIMTGHTVTNSSNVLTFSLQITGSGGGAEGYDMTGIYYLI